MRFYLRKRKIFKVSLVITSQECRIISSRKSQARNIRPMLPKTGLDDLCVSIKNQTWMLIIWDISNFIQLISQELLIWDFSDTCWWFHISSSNSSSKISWKSDKIKCLKKTVFQKLQDNRWHLHIHKSMNSL